MKYAYISKDWIKERIKKKLNFSTVMDSSESFEVSAPSISDNLNPLERLLWKTGTRFSWLIKKIPLLNSVAERYYWRIAGKITTKSIHKTEHISNLLEENWHYHKFLQQLKQEGIKGKVKLFIFKFIGFFAWWQAQLNREILNAISDLNQRLTTLSRVEDAVYLELNNIRADMAEIENYLNEILQQNKTATITETVQDLRKQTEALKTKINSLEHKLMLISGYRELQKDNLYFFLENTFRGPSELIKNRQEQYVKYILKALKNTDGAFVLDIGCGRGEFLKLLSDNSVPARGIDLNKENINHCRQLNLDVELRDAIEFLTNSVDDDSLIGITIFQVIEHLYPQYLYNLLRLCYRKMKKKGVLICETINPNSFYSLKNFYLDPSHIQPIPPETLKTIIEYCGFDDIEIKYLSPVPEEIRLKGDDENTKKLNNILFNFQDYAVIAWKD